MAVALVTGERRPWRPDARVYALLDRMAPGDRTLIVSSNGWDVDGCKKTGRMVAYVDRGGAPPVQQPDLRVTSLEELARSVAA